MKPFVSIWILLSIPVLVFTEDTFDVGSGDREAVKAVEAMFICNGKGKRLAFVRNDFELTEAAAECSTLDNDCWIDLFMDEGKWRYIIDTEHRNNPENNDDYSNKSYGFDIDATAQVGSGPWFNAQPNVIDPNIDHCVKLSKVTGKFHNVDCSQELYPLCRATESIADIDYYGSILMMDEGEYLDDSCIISTISLTTDYDIDSCLYECFNEGLCTQIMIHSSAPKTCVLCRWCNIRHKHTDQYETVMLKLHRTNEAYKNIMISGQSLTDIGGVLYSPSRSYYMALNSNNLVVFDANGEALTLKTNIEKVSVSNDGNVVASYIVNILSTGDDGSKGPYRLSLTDYGQLILFNKDDTIVNVLSPTSDADQRHKDHDVVSPESETYNWVRTCAPFSTFQTVSGGIDAMDRVMLAADIMSYYASCSPVGGVALKGALATYKAYRALDKLKKKSETQSVYHDIFECVTQYVDYAIDAYADVDLANDVSDLKLMINTFFSEWNEANTVEEKFGLFTKDGWSHSYSFLEIVNQILLVIDDAPRQVLPEIAYLMNTRLFWWGFVLNDENVDCAKQEDPSECIANWITTNDECGDDKYKTAMDRFRADNSVLMNKYYQYLPRVWTEIMSDRHISTQHKHDQVHAVWINGIFCEYWLHSTYELSMRSSVTEGCDCQTSENKCYSFTKSYIFDTISTTKGIDFSSYGDGNINLPESIFECKQQLTNNVRQYMSNNDYSMRWNPYEELYGTSDNILKWIDVGTGDQCYIESVGFKNNYDDGYMECGNNKFVKYLSVSSFYDEKGDEPWDISDVIHKGVPLLVGFSEAGCLDVDDMSLSWIIPGEGYMDFFKVTNFGDCYGSKNDKVYQVTSAMCPDHHIATGIQYHRGCYKKGKKYACLLWMIRLQCRSANTNIWGSNDYIMSSIGGKIRFKEDEGEDMYEYEGWSSIYECPPLEAISKIEIKKGGGWGDTGVVGEYQMVTDYDINILCEDVDVWMTEETTTAAVLSAQIANEASGKTFTIQCGSDEIQIVSATYGANCGATLHNQLSNLQNACDGKYECIYTVNHNIIGDPAPGCSKTYDYEYMCIETGLVLLSDTVPSEASGRVLTINCGSDEIAIESATYGGNCGATSDNQLSNLQNACDGKSICSYTVNHNIIGDPAPVCAKTYEYIYTCVETAAHVQAPLFDHYHFQDVFDHSYYQNYVDLRMVIFVMLIIAVCWIMIILRKVYHESSHQTHMTCAE